MVGLHHRGAGGFHIGRGAMNGVCWVYLVAVTGDCEADGCFHDADSALVAMDEQGAGRISPALCEECLWSRLMAGQE